MKIIKLGVLVVVILFLGLLATKILFNKQNVLSPIETRDHVIIKDKFNILLPQDWQEINSVDKSIVFSAQNSQNSYHVTYDVVEDAYKIDYLTYVKQSILKVSPQVKFTLENKDEIEAELSQNKAIYKSWIKIIWGDNNEVYLLSFNSLKSDWESNKQIFDKVMDSFEIKK